MALRQEALANEGSMHFAAYQTGTWRSLCRAAGETKTVAPEGRNYREHVGLGSCHAIGAFVIRDAGCHGYKASPQTRPHRVRESHLA